MHASSYEHMARLVETYLDPQRPLRIADLGSRAVVHAGSVDEYPSYRPLFEQPDWEYVGIDIEAGPNVDVVMPSPYRIPLRTGSVDVFVTGQTFEHLDFFWVLWLDIVRVLRPGGLALVIAPSRGPEHRYPVDCWRFFRDGFGALARWGRVDLLDVSTDTDPPVGDLKVFLMTNGDPTRPEVARVLWGDTVGVFRRPVTSRLAPVRAAVLRWSARGAIRRPHPVDGST
jgi:SAM-dependent methyltransferase